MSCIVNGHPTEKGNEIIRNLNVPSPPGEWHRLAILNECRILDTKTNDEEFDRYTAMCARIFKVPICLVSLVDIDRQWFKSKVGLDAPETHRDVSFCTYTVLSETSDVYVVLDANKDPRFAGGPLVIGHPHVIFYAGAALWVDGEKLGSLCIIDNYPHESFSLDQQQTLLDIAAIVSQVISARRCKFLREQKRQSQQIMSLCHNLRTPCMSLELSVKGLIGSMSTVLSQDIQLKTDHLVLLVNHLTGLCGFMPSLVSDKNVVLRRNGYQCDIVSIVGKLRDVVGCITTYKTTKTACIVDPLFQNRTYSFASFPEIFTKIVLGALAECNNLSLEFDFKILFSSCVSDGVPIISDFENEEKNSLDFNGAAVFDFVIKECSADNAILCRASYQQYEDILKAVGGGFCVNYKSDAQIFGYTFWLPISMLSPVKEDGIVVQDQSNQVRGFPRAKVLVVESDPAAQHDIVKLLENRDCTVCVKSNGSEGLAEYMRSLEEQEHHKYDFVFIDFLMPVMHGGSVMEQLTSWLQEKTSQDMNFFANEDTTFVCILMSGDSWSNYLEPSRNDELSENDNCNLPSSYGISHIIYKPFDPTVINSIIDEKQYGAKGDGDLKPVDNSTNKKNRVRNWFGLRLRENVKIHPC